MDLKMSYINWIKKTSYRILPQCPFLSFAYLLTYLLLMYIGNAKPTIEKTNDPEIEYSILELGKSNKKCKTFS